MGDMNADLFNRKLRDFMLDLESIGIDQVPDYPLFRSSVNLLVSIDPRRPASLFHQYVVKPFGQQILSRDEGFFIESESLGPNTSMPIVSMIKGLWSKLSGRDKDAVWGHFQVLTVLSNRVMGVV